MKFFFPLFLSFLFFSGKLANAQISESQDLADHEGDNMDGGNPNDPEHDQDFAMEVIGGATLVATDANWDVYLESIYFDIQGNFEGNITNGDNDPVASGTYEYQKIDVDFASLSYVDSSTGFSFSYDLNFIGHGYGNYVKEANYGSEIDITSGSFEFSLSHTENDHEGEHGEGHYPDDEGNSHHQPDFVSLPVDEVKSFVDAFVQSREDLFGSRPIWAEKIVDAIKGEQRFVFNVGLDRGFSLIFDQNESFLHALPSDEFAHSEREFIDLDQLPQEISDAISEDVSSYSILDAEKEFSILQSDVPSYVYNVFFEQNGTKYVAHLTAGFNLILIEMDDRGDFEDEWRPVELPAVARDYLEENFADLIGEGTNLFVEERPTPEGESKEIVAFLDDGTELIFDSEGVFIREFNPWKNFEENFDAGLKFDAENSSPLGSASVHIEKVDNDDEHGSLLYRIFLTNVAVDENSPVTKDQLDLADVLSGDSQLTLTFTYEMGTPQYLVVSGSNLNAYKHSPGDWERASSFTIKAQPVAPVASLSNAEGDLGLTFGMLVEMGGERFYEGAVFAANVIALDLSPARYSSPWDPVASFAIDGIEGVDTAVAAFLPRRLLSGKFGIMDPQDVKAALVVEGGGLSYLDGSLRYGPDEGQNLVGSGFERTPFKGHESGFDQGMYIGMHDDPDLSEHQFDDSTSAEPVDGEPVDGEPVDGEPVDGDEVKASKFDFDGDGLANSLLKISFSANSFPAEVQFGDPWVDPYANLDTSTFGTITGLVQDAEGNPLDEFDIWFFKALESDVPNNASDEDDEVAFIVSGGEFSYPYYNFTFESNGSSVDFQNYALIKGKSYTFKAGDISSSHPFNIGSSFQNSSPQASGGPLDQNSHLDNHSINISIPSDFEGSLSYFCTSHQSMLQQFIISDPSPQDFIGNDLHQGHDVVDIHAGEPVFFQVEYGDNGTFTANLPAGNYHAEAVAYDPETDTVYKPQVHGGLENPTLFEIEGNASSYSDVNFALEAEFRISHQFAEVEGIVHTSSEGEGRIEVFFELFPIDDAGQRLTDYPVHSFGVNRDGEIQAHAPLGTFEVEVFSPDNSFSLEDDLTITILEGSNVLDPITLSSREMITVSGLVTDADSNDGVWADLVFVDPENNMVQYWPEWVHLEGVEPPPPGSFSVRIPAGSYLIKAERFDGLYQPAFYDADENGEPDTVIIDANFSDSINIALSSRPTATVTIKLLDSNTSEPVKYAWFDFFDAEDEFAPIIFPQLDGIDFENGFDGTYTLKVPGGTYKLAVGAHGYEHVIRILDESGQPTWEDAGWDDAASFTLIDGNATELGTIQMEEFELSDAELYGFDWMDEGEEIDGSTITGSVKTSEGVAVPKARIIARTKDYLFWFDHVQSRSDGSFELSNLPEGDWMVFAEPPFDSESFQGFRESDEIEVSLPENNGSAIDLTLRGSNVFGRIVFPKKNRDTGETKNNGLANAFVWAYSDENQDGEPDWDEDILVGAASLIEASGETDNNGYFSFYLEEAGKYSLRIDLPGQLSSLAPAPIGFTLKNSKDGVKLGNAVKIDWKAEVKANAFDIERKVSTGSSYISLFAGEDISSSTKPSADTKSFVDSNINPGENYSYRVIAETSNGKVTIDSEKVKVSDPFIFLAPPNKSITGRVLDGSNNPVANAEVVAWREGEMGWSSTFTEDDGSYELTAGPGKWEITVYRPFNQNVDWFYESAPKRVKFSNDSSKQTETKNFTVSKISGGKIVGSIALPDGVTYPEISKYVTIDAFDPEGRGNWGQPDADGNFSIPLQPGQYELSLWIDPQLRGFGSPPVQFVRVGNDTVDIGMLQLSSRDKTISGVVSTDGGKTLPNVEVWAWSEQGGWVSDTTNVSGEYTLSVSPGRWEIGFEIKIPEDGSESPYLPNPPKRLRIKTEDSVKTLNFTAREAGAKIEGVVYGPTGNPVSNLEAWVYASEYSEDDLGEFSEIVADTQLSSKGTFSFPGVPGQYLVGLWLPPGSVYSHPDEKLYEVVVSDGVTTLLDEEGNPTDKVTFDLSANDSEIIGSFKLDGQNVSGLVGEVHAIRVDGDGRQSSAIEDNGTYSLLLSAGNWALDYHIESDSFDRNFPSHPSKPIVLHAIPFTSLEQDFVLTSASASISGTIRYDANDSAVTGTSLFVWAYREGNQFREEYWNEVETDDNGTFSMPVLPGGRYEIGAILSQDLRESGYLDAKVIKADLSSGSVVDLNLTIGKPNPENFISGSVLDLSGNPVEEAFVYAWSDDGREAFAETDENGAFSISVPSGTVWHVGGEYALLDDLGTETYLSTRFEKDIDLSNVASFSDLSLSLSALEFEIPDGNSETFDPNLDFVTKLPDGTKITIPGGAANVSSEVESVRIVVTPTAKGLSKSATEKPADYGYSVELFDDKGKKVEGNFKKDVILSIPVDLNASKAKGMDIQNMEAMYYSTTKDSWDKAKTSTWDQTSSTLTMTTDHFTTFAAVSTPDVSDLAGGLAKIDAENAGDWYSLDWFGDFYDATSGWIYHKGLGWLYVQEDSNGNFWFYDDRLGWLWTGPTYYDESESKAFFYSSTEASWLHFISDQGVRKFYDYSDETWFTPDSN